MKLQTTTTSPQFEKGDIRGDGFIYFTKRKTDGKDYWYSPDGYHKAHISRTFTAARARSVKKDIPFNITPKYLQDIFPEDFVCPVFGTKMAWGGERRTSPSLDRIHPALGYVEGNVIWVSNYANILKNGNSIETLKSLLKFYEKLQGGRQENTY